MFVSNVSKKKIREYIVFPIFYITDKNSPNYVAYYYQYYYDIDCRPLEREPEVISRLKIY